MTDPKDKPSFLAMLVGPLAIIVTAGAVLIQLFAGMIFLYEKGMLHSTAKIEVWISVYPAIAYFVVAVLYHLLKGKPIPGSKVITRLLYSVWALSVIGGAIFCLLN
jgi:uncharacterized membrane protein YdjX (TVP38/TMEM64 family)